MPPAPSTLASTAALALPLLLLITALGSAPRAAALTVYRNAWTWDLKGYVDGDIYWNDLFGSSGWIWRYANATVPDWTEGPAWGSPAGLQQHLQWWKSRTRESAWPSR